MPPRQLGRRLGVMVGARWLVSEPWRRGSLIAACVVVALGGPVAAASPRHVDSASVGVDPATAHVYTLMGDGPRSERDTPEGELATELGAIPDRVAATPDGGFAVRTSERVLRVTPDGRVHSLATGRRWITDVASGPDGSLYLLDANTSVILRVGADGRLAPFAGRAQAFGACRDDGDGGPAAAAHICAERVEMSSAGLLLFETEPATVRRIGLDGMITRVAGDGRSGAPTDGAPATATDLDLDEDSAIAALPDGSPVLLTRSGIWMVGADARLHRLLRIGRLGEWFRALMALADGTVLTGGSRVSVLSAGMLFPLTTDPGGSGLWSAFDGDAGPLTRAHWIEPLDFALDADGGWLIADVGHLRYVTPRTPRRLAVGLAPATVSSRLPVTAVVETTLPAHIAVNVRVHGRRVGATTVDRAAGRWEIPVSGGRTGALNVVSLLASSLGQPQQIATDRIGVVPGGTLPIAVARELADEEAADTRSIGGGDPTMTCRRIDRRRVDCADEDLGLCQRITAYRLRPDGILTGRDYAIAASKCRFMKHPRWANAPGGVALPS